MRRLDASPMVRLRALAYHCGSVTRPHDSLRRPGPLAAAHRWLRRAWFRANRRLGVGPRSYTRFGRTLVGVPLVAFAVTFVVVVFSRDVDGRVSEEPAQVVVQVKPRAAAPTPAAGTVRLKPTATLPAPLRPPPPKPRRTRPAPPARDPAPVTPAAAPTPVPTAAPAPAAPAPTPRAQPQPTPAPTFDDSGEGNGSFDLP
jgi:hypothetical protein